MSSFGTFPLSKAVFIVFEPLGDKASIGAETSKFDSGAFDNRPMSLPVVPSASA